MHARSIASPRTNNQLISQTHFGHISARFRSVSGVHQSGRDFFGHWAWSAVERLADLRGCIRLCATLFNYKYTLVSSSYLFSTSVSMLEPKNIKDIDKP